MSNLLSTCDIREKNDKIGKMFKTLITHRSALVCQQKVTLNVIFVVSHENNRVWPTDQ